MMFKFNITGSWKSLSYLRDIGVLQENGERTCTVTGRDVVEWDLTFGEHLETLEKERILGIRNSEEIMDINVIGG